MFVEDNDLVYKASVSKVYESLKNSVELLNKNCRNPYFGVSVVEPELTLGNPCYIYPKGYKALINSLVKKIKIRNI